MADPARRSAPGPASPDLRAAKEAVLDAARRCDALTVTEFRRLCARLRALVIDDAVIEALAAERAGEILAAEGLVPPPRGRHLHPIR